MNITEIILAISPSVITIFTMIGIVIKVLLNFKTLKKEVTDMKELETVKKQMNMVLEENYELKKTLNETMTIISRVKHGDKSNGKNKEKN